jgi:hypothetical protein
MSVLLARLRRFYGSHPLHLLTMVAGFALAGYIAFTFKPATLWNPQAWWQSIAVWLAGAIIFHDLALFPLYALADRLLGIATWRRRRRTRGQLRVPARNYVRIPALGSGLTLLMFFPGIIRQGSATYVAATGETQQVFLGRWLLLTAAMFTGSALVYAIRLALARRPISGVDSRATQPTRRPVNIHSPRHRNMQLHNETSGVGSSRRSTWR